MTLFPLFARKLNSTLYLFNAQCRHLIEIHNNTMACGTCSADDLTNVNVLSDVLLRNKIAFPWQMQTENLILSINLILFCSLIVAVLLVRATAHNPIRFDNDRNGAIG